LLILVKQKVKTVGYFQTIMIKLIHRLLSSSPADKGHVDIVLLKQATLLFAM